ncbi:pyruvate dehydrogenase E2 component (dihydrolipoamide acetyltransferase) [Mumia flava]|uniref:Dihydrolipoamide acetyltransferase component of pyruvate dehydrogenase complex n=1 Tax=Mumia flava TaxID=1348852 RepID=A0A2M9AQ54_9ACTN|nr:dihydrolipoamide acetyltransferase family protein [Mumia flava]PJJ47837.1 pyruvate dehydrogenase E2 component (dihydrolipoamide acetyltransferase) [Mumia flava]
MAVNEYRMPDPGEGLTEAEIISWRVAVGDEIKVNDIIVEVETAKSLVELPSPYGGVVRDLLVAEGDTVAVGTPIIAVADPSDESDAQVGPADRAAGQAAVQQTVTPQAQEATAHEPATHEPATHESAEGAPNKTLVGYGPREQSTTRRRRRSHAGASNGAVAPAPAAGTPSPPVEARAGASSPPVEARAGASSPPVEARAGASSPPVEARAERAIETPSTIRTLAKPPVRKLAMLLGVDLRDVPPSGSNGIVTREDVEAYADRTGAVPPDGAESAAAATAASGAAPAAQTAPTPATDDRITRVPVKGVRKATAEAMVSSAFTAPHVTEWLTVDVSATMDLVESMKSDPSLADVKVSPLLLIARAVCLALRRTPSMNASFDAERSEIVLKHDVHLGIATASDRGLLVPVVRDADRLSMPELAQGIGEKITAARDGRIPPEDLAGGTFSITNVGVFGVDAGTPILVPGQTGILAVGQIARRPWVLGDEVVPRWVTTLAVSFDHRVVDGADGSRFLADVGRLLTDPARALTF